MGKSVPLQVYSSNIFRSEAKTVTTKIQLAVPILGFANLGVSTNLKNFTGRSNLYQAVCCLLLYVSGVPRSVVLCLGVFLICLARRACCNVLGAGSTLNIS